MPIADSFEETRATKLAEKNLKTCMAIVNLQEKFEESLEQLLEGLNVLDVAVSRNQAIIEKSIPEAAKHLSEQAINSIKAQVTGDLKIEMNQLQSDITAYREQLRDFKQDVNFARSMSRKNTILLCLGSVLGSGMAAAAVLLWSGFTLNNHTLTYQNIGKYVHTVVTKQPQEIQQRFWDGLAKLESLK